MHERSVDPGSDGASILIQISYLLSGSLCNNCMSNEDSDDRGEQWDRVIARQAFSGGRGLRSFAETSARGSSLAILSRVV